MILRFLLIATVLASFINMGQVESACFDLTKAYFECYFLSMTRVSDGWMQYYVPDESVPNNTLDNSAFQHLKNLSVSESIDIMRLIYESVYDCDNYFCYCFMHRKLTFTEDTPYEIYFKSDAIYFDMKQILLDLDVALSDKRKSVEELQTTEGFGSDEDNLPALTEYCAKAEFTKFRANEYTDYNACQIEVDEVNFHLTKILSKYFECF